jgi:iron complex transport system substrate-binding protein
MRVAKEISIPFVIVLLISLVWIIQGSPFGNLDNTELTAIPETNNTDTNSQITIIDSRGREVTLDKPAERIAYTYFTVAEVLAAVGAWDKVVVRDGHISDENFFPGLNELSAITPANNFIEINYEKVVETKPDVFIMAYTGWNDDVIDEVIDTFEPEIPVVFVEPLNPDTFVETVQIIGIVSGNKEQSQELIDFYNGIYDPIVAESSKLSPEEQLNVFYTITDTTQIMSFGEEMTGANELFYTAGARNIAGDLPFSYAEVDSEWLLEQDIDAIMIHNWDPRYTDVFGYTVADPEVSQEKGSEITNEFIEMDVFSNTDAAKNGNVYVLHTELLSTPRQIIAIAYMAKWFHPELYPDLDPEALHQEYINRFFGGTYNLSEDGFFAYPE